MIYGNTKPNKGVVRRYANWLYYQFANIVQYVYTHTRRYKLLSSKQKQTISQCVYVSESLCLQHLDSCKYLQTVLFTVNVYIPYSCRYRVFTFKQSQTMAKFNYVQRTYKYNSRLLQINQYKYVQCYIRPTCTYIQSQIQSVLILNPKRSDSVQKNTTYKLVSSYLFFSVTCKVKYCVCLFITQKYVIHIIYISLQSIKLCFSLSVYVLCVCYPYMFGPV